MSSAGITQVSDWESLTLWFYVDLYVIQLLQPSILPYKVPTSECSLKASIAIKLAYIWYTSLQYSLARREEALKELSAIDKAEGVVEKDVNIQDEAKEMRKRYFAIYPKIVALNRMSNAFDQKKAEDREVKLPKVLCG